MGSPYCSAKRLVDEGVLVATIEVGEIREPSTAYDVRNELLDLIKEAEIQHLIIDAHNLIFVGSVGFLAFLGVRREFAGRIVLCNLSPTTYESFSVCRLISPAPGTSAPFEVADSLEAALSMFVSNP